MKFLSRKVRAAKPVSFDQGPVIHREIEIRVEREWISMTAFGQSEGVMQAPASGEHEPEQILGLLPLPKRE